MLLPIYGEEHLILRNVREKILTKASLITLAIYTFFVVFTMGILFYDETVLIIFFNSNMNFFRGKKEEDYPLFIIFMTKLQLFDHNASCFNLNFYWHIYCNFVSVNK